MVEFRLPLKKDKFGIMTPNNSKLKITRVDLAIVPILGIDKTFRRIGFGKGMYDRFFEKLKKRPYIIFTQLEFCHTKKFICDDYDIAGDILLTPKKIMTNKNI